MDNFNFTSPTRFVFGRGAEKSLARELHALGDVVLFHYGQGSIRKLGLYDQVKETLQVAGVECVELGDVKPNPSLALVREGVEICRSRGVSGILAVGGGSVIDSAKAIAAGALYEGDVWDFYMRKAQLEKALPLATILTISAAGSEGSPSSVVSDDDKGLKLACGSDLLRPVFSLLNPEFTCRVSAFQTACGVSDMLSHVMERYFSDDGENAELSDGLCESLMRTIIKLGRRVMEKPDDYQTRAELMWASTVAHTDIVGLGRQGDWASHKIEHELSAQYDVAHGAGLAVIFPAWMRHVYTGNPDRFVRFAVNVWGVTGRGDSPQAREEVILEGIGCLEDFYHSLGLETSLGGLGIGEDRLELMARGALRFGPPGELKKLEYDDVLSIYEKSTRKETAQG